MAAIQRMRAKAQAAGTLKSGSQIKVVQETPQTIIIQPANPQIVYVPTYNPTVIYGAPVVVPGYSSADVAHGGVTFFRRRDRGGGGGIRRLLRMGMELLGHELAQPHHNLQPQHLCRQQLLARRLLRRLSSRISGLPSSAAGLPEPPGYPGYRPPPRRATGRPRMAIVRDFPGTVDHPATTLPAPGTGNPEPSRHESADDTPDESWHNGRAMEIPALPGQPVTRPTNPPGTRPGGGAPATATGHSAGESRKRCWRRKYQGRNQPVTRPSTQESRGYTRTDFQRACRATRTSERDLRLRWRPRTKRARKPESPWAAVAVAEQNGEAAAAGRWRRGELP